MRIVKVASIIGNRQSSYEPGIVLKCSAFARQGVSVRVVPIKTSIFGSGDKIKSQQNQDFLAEVLMAFAATRITLQSNWLQSGGIETFKHVGVACLPKKMSNNPVRLT